MSAATSPTLELNNGVTMPALGFSVFQTPPEETAASAEQMSATTQQTNASTQEVVASVEMLSSHSERLSELTSTLAR